eukprot:TRINITY_DN45083_c0_g1_i1.p1 TRINITY_DN45083_c0_g1~~TRINITY_DN45083_c0_g1_i1.p1  ORF type:complete len:134 (+),score=40.93 TRINITY_DN45083_c0_g1_i1:63-464(+)
MDPGWMMLYVFMLCEALAVAVLTMPMPSNHVRKIVITGLMSIWTKFPNLRYISYALLTLNGYYFYASYMWLHEDHDHSTTAFKTRLFREQRNAYLTGMGLGLFFILRRLMDLHTQLHAAREAQKEAEAEKKTH